MTNQQIKTRLKNARKVVNSLEFGTIDWDDAMEVVKVLTNMLDSQTDFGPHTSVDGDIFQRQN